MVRLLLKNGTDPESKVVGRRPLIEAIIRGSETSETIIQLLLEKGASVNSMDTTGRTPLSHAAEKGAVEVVRLLLKNGSYIESKDTEGRTPLSYAVANPNNNATVELLLDEGADAHSTDNKGDSPYGRSANDDYTSNFAMSPWLPPGYMARVRKH